MFFKQSGTNLLSKFHEDRKINVASRVKNALPPGCHVFQPSRIIFKLVQDIIGINLLTKFYEDQTINVASIVKNAPPLGSHVFQANISIFELIQNIIETNLLTKFHEDWTINVASRELTSQMLTPHNAHGQKAITKAHHKHINILTKFHEDWMKTINILTKFHKDWMKTATSIVYASDLINILTKFDKDWMKTATSIINILTKFHKDWIKTVTSTVYTSKLLTDARTHACTHIRTPDITQSHKLTMSLRDRRPSQYHIDQDQLQLLLDRGFRVIRIADDGLLGSKMHK
ncbi:hypothetical protein DPMN_051736 [Dreissena polymorpha]|uniref:Uncharacterized protein n=1 Tax=Dreissena polymorpha TaxID=45954 RepID=A0A9D4CID5_DREPO|nr:hypothetical protein DPMN_051736 [Dreissena polymorpha]